MKIAVLSFALMLCFCDRQRSSAENDAITFPDSLKAFEIAAACKTGDGRFIFLNKDEKTAVRLIVLKDGSSFTEPLARSGCCRYSSLRYNYSYVVTDSSVQEIFHRKVVHPSSNWQGQTPGEEDLVEHMERTDLVTEER
jgi:hypothetical protein